MLEFWGTARSGGGDFGRVLDLAVVGESDTADDPRQLVFYLQFSPGLGGGHDQFENHRAAGIWRERTLRAYCTVPAVEKTLSIGLVVKKRTQCSAE